VTIWCARRCNNWNFAIDTFVSTYNGNMEKRFRLNKTSSLHLAAGSGDVDTVEQFAKNKRSLFIGGICVTIAHLDPSGASLLSLAASGGHVNVVQFLVQMPLPEHAGVNGPTNSGTTPLMYASEGGHEAIVQLLISSKANPNSVNAMGETALHHAARNKDIHTRDRIMTLLNEAGADPSTRNGKSKCANDLIYADAAPSPALAPESAGDGEQGRRGALPTGQKGDTKGGRNPVAVEHGHATTAPAAAPGDESKPTHRVPPQHVGPHAATASSAAATVGWDLLGRRTPADRALPPPAAATSAAAASPSHHAGVGGAARGDEGGDEDELALCGFVPGGAVEPPREELVARQLRAMGFCPEPAARAARATGGRSAEAAVEWLDSPAAAAAAAAAADVAAAAAAAAAGSAGLGETGKGAAEWRRGVDGRGC
jgi:hypothetical protein